MVDARTMVQHLTDLYQRAGFVHRDPAVLQPADIFLDFSGEDIRRRLFVTENSDGRLLCLRPEFTIPIALEHIAFRRDLPVDVFAYGPVFRRRSDDVGEFTQVDIERIGHPDHEIADAECFALALETLKTCGLNKPKARIGDLALVRTVLEQLKISPTARRRIVGVLSRGATIDTLVLDPDANPAKPVPGLLKVLEGADQTDAKALVADLLSIAGITKVGGRDIDAIADRFLRRAAGEIGSIRPEQADQVRRFLAIAGDPVAALKSLRAYEAEEGLDVAAPLARAERRIGLIAAQGVDLSTLSFETALVRNLDYYSGFIFELFSASLQKPVIGGGRYDSLMRRLGSSQDIAAIGFAVWPERIARELT